MKMRGSTIILPLAAAAIAENFVFPDDAGLIDVTKPPYELRGDATTDNTAALRKAFADFRGTNRTLYFPNGTYLFSDRINISADRQSQPHSPDRFLNIQGQSQAGVVLKLADNSPGYDDPGNPKAFISLYEGVSTGDVMHSYVRNITVEIGAGNPGAAAFRFMTNNTGAMYDVTIRSSDPDRRGAIGLDLRQSQNGPGMIKRITVDGFDYGIQTGNSFSLVFEHIIVRNQRKAGFYNNGARTTLRDLVSRNNVPALINDRYGHLTLVGADLGGGASEAAIINQTPMFFARDVKAQGYAHTIKTGDGGFVDGAVDERYEGRGRSLFGAKPATLRLPIKETPEIPLEPDLSKWVKVEPGSDKVQKAIDSAAKRGGTTVYFPKLGPGNGEGRYQITRPVRVHGSVNRIIGLENIVDISDSEGVFSSGAAVFTFENLVGDAIVIERFFLLGGWKCPTGICMFENKSKKTIVLRNACVNGLTKKADPGGTWFFEDVAPGRESTLEIGRKETVWARQYNPETYLADMIHVDGGVLWLLGLKTEGRTTHIAAKSGAKVELLGSVSYQSWIKQALDPPMFIVDGSSEVSLTFGLYHTNTPFTTIVQETKDSVTRSLLAKDLEPFHLPLYRSSGPYKTKGE